jgi:hypothetical protein
MDFSYSLAVPLWLVILLTCVYSLVVIFGVFGNILVIQAVARSVNLVYCKPLPSGLIPAFAVRLIHLSTVSMYSEVSINILQGLGRS